MRARLRSTVSLAWAATFIGCGDGTGPLTGRFLDGTAADPGIALTISYSHNSLHMVQTGAPTAQEEIPLGASSDITPVGFAVRGTSALIPLGNAGSVALADLEQRRVERFFILTEGNVTGAAWIDDTAAVVCHSDEDYCGRLTLTQASDSVTDTVHVTAYPTGAVVVGSRVFLISSNLDDSFQPADSGIVTEIDPATLAIVRTFTVGINPQFGAAGPGGNLYITNSGHFFGNDGSLSIIDLGNNTVETIDGFGEFPGIIAIDAAGRAFISSYDFGTIVWDIGARTFVRGLADPVCAPLAGGGGCRGATSAELAPNGDLYQAFFGSAADGQPAYLFVYDGGTLALRDSLPVPIGPNGLVVRRFR